MSASIVRDHTQDEVVNSHCASEFIARIHQCISHSGAPRVDSDRKKANLPLAISGDICMWCAGWCNGHRAHENVVYMCDEDMAMLDVVVNSS